MLPDSLSPGRLLADRYRIDSLLADAGDSLLLRGFDVRADRALALKVLHPDLLNERALTERFRREGRALASLESVHVVRVLAVEELDDIGPLLAMELLEGLDLDQHLDESGPRPWAEAVGLVRQAAEGVGEAHAHGLVHRDLKPANLFLTRDGVVKVIDFGIAKRIVANEGEEALTALGDAVGSPLYMSPEQLRSGVLDVRTDVWSLGVTLYELIVGITPFEDDTPAITLWRISSEPAPRLSSEVPDVPAELDAIVARCLEKSPSKRFGSMFALGEALAPFDGIAP
jgi:eukaryotic-like serine/threonine-protein kinase